MSNEIFNVQNVKCGGCVSAIQEGLGALEGVDSVEVVIESGQVSIAGEALDRTVLANKLSELGYPPK
jgi:copper chaperone CopZ